MIKYLEMRNELLLNIRTLADPDFQRRVWILYQKPRPIYEHNLDMVIHFIFDDMQLDINIEDAVGDILENIAEAKAVKKVVDVLDKMFESGYTDKSDEEWINSPLWTEVVICAQDAYSVLSKGKNPEGLFEDRAKGII